MAARLAVSKPQWHSLSHPPTASIGMQRSIRPGRFLDGEVHHNVDQEWASRPISAIAEIRPRLLAQPRPGCQTKAKRRLCPSLTKARSQTYLLISFSSMMAQAERPQTAGHRSTPMRIPIQGTRHCRHVDPAEVMEASCPPCIGSALSQPLSNKISQSAPVLTLG